MKKNINLAAVFLLVFYHASDSSVGGQALDASQPSESIARQNSEHVMSRLERKGIIYEFVKVSSEFSVIRLESDKNKVFFSFTRPVDNGGSHIWDGELIDVLVNNEEISVLISGGSWYRVVTASSNAPKPPKGHIFINLEKVAVGKLKLLSDAAFFEPEAHGPENAKVESIRLVDSKSVEFAFRQANDGELESHVLSFEGDRLFFDSEFVSLLPSWHAIISEEDVLRQINRTESNHLLRQQIEQVFGGKEEFLKMVGNYKDKKVHDKIVERTNQAFAEPEP